MFTAIQLVIVVLSVAGDGSGAADAVHISKADIPANISPELGALLEELVAADNTLDSVESTVKQDTAVKKLHALGGRALPAIPFLVKYAVRKEEYQTYAPWEAEAFAMMGERAAKPCLDAIKQLASKKRKTAVRIFATSGTPWMVDVVRELRFTDPDPEVRHKATWELAGCSNPPVIRALILELRDRDPELRRRAIEHFRLHHEPQALEPLFEALKEEPNTTLRVDIIDALGMYNDARVPPVLIALIRSRQENVQVRRRAAFILWLYYESFIFDPFMAILTDATEPVEVRSEVAYWLGMLRDARTFDPFVAILRNPTEPTELRADAAAELGGLDNVRAVPLLMKVVKSTTGDTLAERRLRYCAAASVVTLSKGAVGELAIVTSIRDFRLNARFKNKDDDEWHDPGKDLLEEIARSGDSRDIRDAADAALKESDRALAAMNAPPPDDTRTAGFVRPAVLTVPLFLLLMFWAFLRVRRLVRLKKA